MAVNGSPARFIESASNFMNNKEQRQKIMGETPCLYAINGGRSEMSGEQIHMERRATIKKVIFVLVFAAFALFGPGSAYAQTSQTLKAEELDQLVAPVALYPDTLLSQILIAATYPLEVVAAERWTIQNKSLKGEALKKAVDQQKWDDSIKALTATPDVLTMMSEKLDWTQKLGDAVLAQQTDVMDAIQRLRQRAQASNKLKTTQQQKVTTTTQNKRQYITIEPANPNTVYVPYYDPAVVYGSWPYPEYPPYYFGAPGYIAGGVLATGLAFGIGYAVGAWVHGGNWWGGSFNWGNNNININNDIDINKRKNWEHRPEHRHGVRYNNDSVKQKFGKGDIGSRDQRMDFRGRDGQQVLKPGAGQPGDRPGGRPETRPGDRSGAGERPGKDVRPGGDKRPGGDRPGKEARPGDRRPSGDRPQARPQGPQKGGAFDHVNRASAGDHARGQASLGSRGGGGGPRHIGGSGGGGRHIGGGGGGPRGGGARGGGRRR